MTMNSIKMNTKGFSNLGNTCYMNSALQALLSSDILNEALIFFLQKIVSESCFEDIVKETSPLLMCYYSIIFGHINTTNTTNTNTINTNYINNYNNINNFSPIQFKNKLDEMNNWFKGYSQHDSNEFMLYMLNEFIDGSKNKQIGELIKSLCFGKYKQYICCYTCRNVAVSYHNFLDIVLPIPDMPNPTLEDCFVKMASYEKLCSDNSWDCPVCKTKVNASKKIEIETVPDVAVFTFNRSLQNVTITKNNTAVKIYPYIRIDGKKLKLISTINHYGSIGGGHYVANILRNNVWYRANDSSVSKINVENILNDSSIYMTIYQAF